MRLSSGAKFGACKVLMAAVVLGGILLGVVAIESVFGGHLSDWLK